MDMNLAPLVGNLHNRKRGRRVECRAAPVPSRYHGLRRLVAAMSVLAAVVGL